MTSKFSIDNRELLQRISSGEAIVGIDFGNLIVRELAAFRLSAMDSEPVAYISKSDFDAGYPHILARRDFNKACTMAVYAAQPAPVVPELRVDWQENEFSAGWNACRAAMLQELQKSAGVSNNCRSNEKVQAVQVQPVTGINPAPTLGSFPKTGEVLTPNSLVIPNEMTSEQAYEIGYYYGDPVDVFARGANWMRQHIIDSTLAAAPQLPGSDPATVPGKWIPVNERMPEAEGHYLVWANASRIDGYCDHLAIATYQGGEWSNEFNWLVNHWMPLPAAPQEGK